MSKLEAIIWSNNKLKVLDQLLLPRETVYVDVNDTKDGWRVINKMQVRGAPAIAIVGCLSLAAELSALTQPMTPSELHNKVKEKMEYIVTARPTAVNIKTAATELIEYSQSLVGEKLTTEDMVQRIRSLCVKMLETDRATNKAIGDYGAKHILETVGKKGDSKVTLLTICNTGSLATAGYGTALGVVRSVANRDALAGVYMLETRPYLQGSRLSAYEAVVEQWPNASLVCDGAVAALLSSRKVDAAVVGADRVAANGDTANKIGTYQLALLCAHFKVPFYVCTPFSSVDLSIKSGDLIPIEERPGAEMKSIGGVQITPQDIDCWNPAFDITPNSLVTGGFVTEKGVITASKLYDTSPATGYLV